MSYYNKLNGNDKTKYSTISTCHKKSREKKIIIFVRNNTNLRNIIKDISKTFGSYFNGYNGKNYYNITTQNINDLQNYCYDSLFYDGTIEECIVNQIDCACELKSPNNMTKIKVDCFDYRDINQMNGIFNYINYKNFNCNTCLIIDYGCLNNYVCGIYYHNENYIIYYDIYAGTKTIMEKGLKHTYDDTYINEIMGIL